MTTTKCWFMVFGGIIGVIAFAVVSLFVQAVG